MPSPACRSQTLVQQHESCRPRRPAPSPRVPRSRDGSSMRPRRDPRRTDGQCPAPALTRGVVARIVTGPHDAHQQDPHLPLHATTPRRDGGPCAGCGRGVGLVGFGPASRPSSGDLGRHPGRAVSGYRRPQARSRDPVPGGPRILTRWCVARGGGVMRCAGRRNWPCGAAAGLAPPAPAAPDTRRAGPRRRAVPARG